MRPVVSFPESRSVDALKKVIKEENQDEFGRIDAPSLDLWRVSIPAAELDTKLQRCEDPSQVHGARKLHPLEHLSTIFPERHSRTHLHITVQPPTNQPPSKKSRLSNLAEIDSSYNPLSVIERWRSKHIGAMLLPVADLPRIVETPLQENEKVLITSSRMRDLVSAASETRDICTHEDVELLFRASETSIPLDKFFFTAFDAPPTDGTEDLFHSFWDDNIRKVLELLVPMMKSTQNSGKHTATRNLLSDYAFLMQNLCPFRGEEQGLGSSEDGIVGKTSVGL